MFFHAGGRTLQILHAQEEDAGRYTCVATNEAGETLKNYEVKVYSEYKSLGSGVLTRVLLLAVCDLNSVCFSSLKFLLLSVKTTFKEKALLQKRSKLKSTTR